MTPITHPPYDNPTLIAELSAAARVLWAKSDYLEGIDWLPLYQHIADSAAVAGTLWDEFLPSATQRVVADAFDGDHALARKIAVWLAASHDLGKATPAFTQQVDRLREEVEQTGLPIRANALGRNRDLPHSAAGFQILKRWLKQEHGFKPRFAAMYACIPLGHHGSFHAPAPEHDSLDSPLLGDCAQWHEVQHELTRFAAATAGMTDADFALIAGRPLPQPAAIILTALTIQSDWIASNTGFFPLRSTPREPDAAAEAMAALRLPPPWKAAVPDDARLFSDHLGLADPRPLQTGLVDLARTLPRPELMILEAPTGEGKTKAALGASEVLATRFDLGGVLFALPTQATSDGIFSTVHEWLRTAGGSTDVSLALAHGKAQFNAEYTAIKDLRLSPIDDPDGHGGIVAHWFLTGRGKLATTSDFVVGTIDQLLLGALRAKHVVLRHLGVAGKVVVIDEVHAADAFMRRYLCRMLTWLAVYDVPVIAMSATLTPSIRNELIGAYNEGRGRPAPRPEDDEAIVYPRITWSTDDGAAVVALPASSRTSTLTVSELSGSTEDISAAALAAARDGGNVAVVCNTVRRAQDVYRFLNTEAAQDMDTMLLHSRFLTPDRMDKEQDLRRRLGPDSTHDDAARPLIVVATQVIEQSLDIDFDVMFSDIAPVDLLIQRAGRLHRHSWKDERRPREHRTAQLTLTGFTRNADGPPTLDRGCRAVYGASALLRAIATLDEHLRDHEVLTSPGDVAPLVTRAYETITPPAGWEETWRNADEKARKSSADQKQRADTFRIPPPGTKSLVEWDSQSVGDPSGERGAAQVRDGEDSIEVVVVQRINGRRVIPTWAHEYPDESVDLATVTDDHFALAASKNTLRLPGFLGSDGLGDQLIDELEDDCIDTWQNSRWLRGALPLVLDENGDATHAGFDFHYDTDLGLVVTTSEEK
ncbi:MAG: CRISPR-associated helicase Cas3' [Gordonia sp. (in: high G+C Gram-positive bacteria)]|uniref:CRISPR-associated helicase Cas3' n=1 Tax=Gordonia sp. (in: high G+C Gram-positive bacteria) TaxID=84139 RepID=UPI0039E60C9C